MFFWSFRLGFCVFSDILFSSSRVKVVLLFNEVLVPKNVVVLFVLGGLSLLPLGGVVWRCREREKKRGKGS